MAADNAVNSKFLELIKARRSIYALGDELPISKEQVTDLVKSLVRESPSSFNSQSSRVVILFGDDSKKVWSIIKDILKGIVPAENFEPTEQKMDAFASGAGTILFYEDEDVIKGLQENFPLYADAFPQFSQHSTGMVQFAVWSALAEQQIGASLQHYQPLPDQAFQEAFGVPKSWKLQAQMPFGNIKAPAGEKTYMKDEDRFKIFGL